MRSLLALPVLCLVLAALPVTAQAAGETQKPWEPAIEAAAAWASERTGVVSIAVRTKGRLYGRGLNRVHFSASVVKPMLMVAYLNSPGVRSRPLGPADRALLAPMVTRSDNATASQVYGMVGASGLERLAARAGMRNFSTESVWGRSRITAADQTKLWLNFDRFVVDRHRAYAMRLVRSVVPGQRWGIAADPPQGWGLSFKSGWVPGTHNQVALLRRGSRRIAVAILVSTFEDYIYARKTQRGVAQRLLRRLRPDSLPR